MSLCAIMYIFSAIKSGNAWFISIKIYFNALHHSKRSLFRLCFKVISTLQWSRETFQHFIKDSWSRFVEVRPGNLILVVPNVGVRNKLTKAKKHPEEKTTSWMGLKCIAQFVFNVKYVVRCILKKHSPNQLWEDASNMTIEKDKGRTSWTFAPPEIPFTLKFHGDCFISTKIRSS